MAAAATRSRSMCLFFSLLLLPAFALNMDGILLLSFKYSILSDPLSVLANWNYSDATPCLWTGVTCAPFLEVELRVTSLVLPRSKLLGTVPEDLGFIQYLKVVDLSDNFFNGTLPPSLFNASQLELLSLSNNAFSGLLHESVAFPKGLKLLNLSDNAFSGEIPRSLTPLSNLSVLSLRNNYFSGPVPSVVQSVEFLDLSSNLLNGSLPLDFGGMHLRHLNLSSNRISGRVPQEFASQIPANATVDLSFNNLSGEIPESTPLSNQETGAFAGNVDLCGKQVKKLCTVPSTLSIPPNVSSNSSFPAIAAIPQIMGHDPSNGSTGERTDGGQNSSQHRLKPGVIAGIAVGDLAGIGVLAILFLYIYQRKKRASYAETKDSSIISTSTAANGFGFKKDSEPESMKESRTVPIWPCLSNTNEEDTSEATSSDAGDNDVITDHHQEVMIRNERSLVMVDGETELDLETLLKASAYVLGSAGSSIVYKAVIEDGTAFAVRRIGESGVQRFKEFENQVKSIAKLRHQNLVQIKGFYWGDDEKLLIHDYVSNGSLASASYRKAGSPPWSLDARLKIAKGVARGLAYIHEKKNVHGNIKPTNILLTAAMEPMISDLGLHWLIHGKQSGKTDRHGLARHYGSMRSAPSHHDFQDHGVGFVGCTSPYHAPESLKSQKPSPKWDVYSFGILLLELLTGKVFLNRELSRWTEGSVRVEAEEVLRMVDGADELGLGRRDVEMLAWFKLGLNCASLIPNKRPSMKDAVNVLEQIPYCSQSYNE